LPAFSCDAAGVNVLGDPRWAKFRCHVITGERVLDFGEVKVLAARMKNDLPSPRDSRARGRG